MKTGQMPDAGDIAHRLAIEHVLNMHCRGVDRASAREPEKRVLA